MRQKPPTPPSTDDTDHQRSNKPFWARDAKKYNSHVANVVLDPARTNYASFFLLVHLDGVDVRSVGTPVYVGAIA